MKIRDLDNACVVDVDMKSISDAEICELELLLNKKAGVKRVGLNMENVDSLSHAFGSLLQNFANKSKFEKLSLFNLNNDSLLFLYITKYDQSADIYLSEDDFCADKNSFVNRRFKVVKAA